MLINQFHKNLPEYYDSMYLDGYTPEQIMEAHHRSMVKKYYADQKRKQEEAAAEKAVEAEGEKQLEKAVSKALDDIFKDWKYRTAGVCSNDTCPGGEDRRSSSRFFRFCPCYGSAYSWSITGGKTDFGNKLGISWERCPHKSRIGC